MRPALDFWFFVGSPYTYMTVARIDDVARQHGVDVRWRTFNLRPILHDVGLPKGPFAPFPLKMAYMWNDLERRARRHGIPYKKPTQFPVEPELLATKVAIVGLREDWGKEFTKAAFTDNFVHGKVLGTEENVRTQIENLGLNAEEILVRARSGETEEQLARETAEIRGLGAFGSPHFVVGRELFWGDDRLEDAMAYATGGTAVAAPATAARKRGGLFARLLGNAG